MICHKYKSIFIHINRTGGTSVERAFGQNLSLNPKVQHATAAEIEIKHPIIWGSYYKFSTIRNPWDRVVSIWKNRIEDPINWPNISFKDWLKSTYEDCIPTLFTGPQLNFINNTVHLIRFENFVSDWKQTCRDLNAELQLGHFNKSNRNNYQSYYEDNMIELVEKIHKQDIEFFNYKF